MRGTNQGLAKPPAGVLAGENVPRENEADEQVQAAIEEMVGLMKGHPAYQDKSDDELQEAAKEKLL